MEHISEGLLPGERYQVMISLKGYKMMRYDDDVELNHQIMYHHHHQVEVKSMTDSQKNIHEKTPTEIFLTKPLPPSRVKITESCDQVRSDVTGYHDGKE